MYKYRLYYLADNDDSCPKKYISKTEIVVGNVILLDNDYYHFVSSIKKQKTGVRLNLSKSAHDLEEAILLAEHYGHIPEGLTPPFQLLDQ